MTTVTETGTGATVHHETVSAAVPSAATATAPRAARSIVAFCCRECAYAAADTSANARTPLPPTVRLILLPCTGRVSPLHLLSAHAAGADGVMVAGCLEGQCHYREGNFNAIDRVKFVQRLLDSVGFEPERCRIFTMSAGEPPTIVAAVKEMDRVVGALPPLARRPAGEILAAPGAGVSGARAGAAHEPGEPALIATGGER
jgi:coenzyme F420-reducing hydrogenase delta subunit